MSKFFNWCLALLMPAMASCGGGKVQDVPEEIYACPMPSDTVWNDEPEEDLPEPIDTTTNK